MKTKFNFLNNKSSLDTFVNEFYFKILIPLVIWKRYYITTRCSDIKLKLLFGGMFLNVKKNISTMQETKRWNEYQGIKYAT